MLSASRRVLVRGSSSRVRVLSHLNQRYKSSSAVEKESLHPPVYPFDEDGNAGGSSSAAAEVVKFPAVDRDDPTYNADEKPVLLNSKEHAVGYLSRILNARVYEAAIETELQHAKNLSAVRCESMSSFGMFVYEAILILTFSIRSIHCST